MQDIERQDVAKHVFTIFFAQLSEIIKNSTDNKIQIRDKDLYKRLISVLRLKFDERFILFDEKINATFALDKKTFDNKKVIYAEFLQQNQNKSLAPEVIFCPALLKRSSFADVTYFAAQMGANEILPIITEKTQRKWGGSKEQERLQKIIVSACEQSKNFVLPKLNDPLKLQDFLKDFRIEDSRIEDSKKIKKILFDPDGKPLIDLFNELNNKKIEKIFILIGPEGDFLDSEIDLIKKSGFVFYKLTKAILRSTEAASVGLGSIRSIF